MALVRRLKRSTLNRNSLHEEVDASYSIFEHDGRYILQIDSFGTRHRQIPGKKSQTFQFGPDGISELRRVLSEITTKP